MKFEVGATADRLLLTAGRIVVKPGGAIVSIATIDGFGPGTYDLIDFAAGQGSGFENLVLSATTINGDDVYLQTTPTAEQLVVVPEPSTFVLAAVALCCVAIYRRGI